MRRADADTWPGIGAGLDDASGDVEVPPLRAFGATDRGPRPDNEDAMLLAPALGLFAVADGLGGHDGGEVASRLALDVVACECGRVDAEDGRPDEGTRPADVAAQADASAALTRCDRDRLERALRLAHRAIRKAQGEAEPGPRSHGMPAPAMATTCTALWVGRDATGAAVAQIAHVGDTRAYRIRDGAIEQLTRDHSLLATLDDVDALTPELRLRYGHVLARALGTRDGERVDARTVDVLPGDAFVLCSDGVHGVLDDRHLLEIVASHSVELAAERLVAAALAAGSRDNVTAVVVRVAASSARHSGIVPRRATPPLGIRRP